MKGRVLERVVAAARAHRSVALVTDLATGRQLLLEPAPAEAGGDMAEGDLTLDDAALGSIRQAWRAGRNRTIETAAGRVFVEVLTPPMRCFVVGAVHIAQPLSQMLTMVDYAVTVIDPRGAFATQARFPDVELVNEWPDEALERLHPDRGSAVIALTHDPKLDDPALAAALRSECFYIGALGSRRNHAARCARLKEQGFSDADLARIHGPIGLAIGAVSPAEVGTSIVAEMIQVLRQGRGAEAG
jgi:xanthine dehydrogenase accessory factor